MAAAARASTPSASAISNDSLDTSNGEQWWLPQPHPSLDESHSEWRPAGPMAEALQCTLCKDLLKEAITAAECAHSYCYDCIDNCILVGGKANVCPVCKVLLGPNPWEHGKLRYDFMLDSLVRKVFPRPKLDKALEARRLEREEATRQAKANLSKRAKTGFAQRTPSSTQLAASGGRAKTAAAAAGGGTAAAAAAAAAGSAPVAVPDRPGVMMMLHPLKLPPSSSSRSSQRLQELAPLPKPYITVPAACRLPVLKTYVVDRLAGKKGEASRMPPLHLECAGQVLGDDWSVQELYDKVWQPHQQGKQQKDEVMVVYYAATVFG